MKLAHLRKALKPLGESIITERQLKLGTETEFIFTTGARSVMVVHGARGSVWIGKRRATDALPGHKGRHAGSAADVRVEVSAMKAFLGGQ